MAFLKRHKCARKVREKSPLPPVTTVADSDALKSDGRRLDMLTAAEITVVCECGHRGQVRVSDLMRRHGGATRLKDALAGLRCSHCGRTEITRIMPAEE